MPKRTSRKLPVDPEPHLVSVRLFDGSRLNLSAYEGERRGTLTVSEDGHQVLTRIVDLDVLRDAINRLAGMVR